MRIIEIPSNNWRPDDRRIFHFGRYRVPLDMSEDLADLAIAEGVAVVVPVETKPAPAVAERKVVRRAAPKE